MVGGDAAMTLQTSGKPLLATSRFSVLPLLCVALAHSTSSASLLTPVQGHPPYVCAKQRHEWCKSSYQCQTIQIGACLVTLPAT